MEKQSRKTRTPPPPTLKKVTGELWLLYKEARSGKVDVADASKLATILNVLLSGIKGTDLEARIEGLEAVAQNYGGRK